MFSKYDPSYSIELVKKKVYCDDCKKYTRSLSCIFNDNPDYDREFTPDEITIKDMIKHDAFRCENCESLNRDCVLVGLYHKEKNPDIFKKEWGKNGSKIERLIKN